MGPSWHEPSAQALNQHENYACRFVSDFGDRYEILLHSLHEQSALANRWVR